MNSYSNKKDFKVVDSLMQISLSIGSLYSKLADLEIAGKKDSDEYRKTIEYLKISIETENEVLNSVFSLGYKYSEIVEYLRKSKKEGKLQEDYESAIEEDMQNNFLIRILSKLNNKKTTETGYVSNFLLEIMEKSLGISREETLRKVIVETELKNGLKKDYLINFFIILQDFCTKKQYQNTVPCLLLSKYVLFYISPSIETDFIESEFELPEVLCSNASIVATLYSISADIYEARKNYYGMEAAIDSISEILNLDSKNAPQLSSDAIIKMCFLCSSFMLMDDESLHNLNYEFHSKIEGDEYLEQYPNNSTNERIVIDCFKQIVRYRKKQQQLPISKSKTRY